VWLVAIELGRCVLLRVSRLVGVARLIFPLGYQHDLSKELHLTGELLKGSVG
jgi:hypothetical protein